MRDNNVGAAFWSPSETSPDCKSKIDVLYAKITSPSSVKCISSIMYIRPCLQEEKI